MRLARAVEQRLNAHHDFAPVEGLDEIIVGADLQARQAILHLAAAGDEDDRDVRGALHGAQGLADFPAAALRHHHVEQHDVRQARLRHRERLLAVVRDENIAVERLQIRLQQDDDVFTVVGDQNDRPWHSAPMIAENRPENNLPEDCRGLRTED